MNAAIFNMITSRPAVSALIGTRCFPRVAVKESNTFPLITFRKNATNPTHAKNSVSGLDFVFYDLYIYSRTQLEADQISAAVRSSLDGYSGTHEGVNIGYVYFYDEDSEPYLEDIDAYVNRIELKLEIKR